MSAAPPLLREADRRRADGRELWLLRAQRGSGLPAPAFGLAAGLATFAVTALPALAPDADRDRALAFVASGAFFGVSIGMIGAIMPGVFAAALEELERLRPILPDAPEDLALFRRARTRLKIRPVSVATFHV